MPVATLGGLKKPSFFSSRPFDYTAVMSVEPDYVAPTLPQQQPQQQQQQQQQQYQQPKNGPAIVNGVIVNGTAYPTELPPRPPPSQTPFSRMCPGFRSFTPGLTIKSYSLATNGDRELLLRRICMILVLIARTADTILLLVVGNLGTKILAAIVGVIMFLCVAHWLHLIGSMTGYRKVFGCRVGRWHYDAFLFIMVLVHGALLFLAFIVSLGYITNAVWFILGLLIFGAAWVTLWHPEPTETLPS